MTRLVLYTRPGCHLCDQALAVVNSVESIGQVQKRDISGNLELVSRYAGRIPVLVRTDGQELEWPFSASDVERLTQAPGGPGPPG